MELRAPDIIKPLLRRSRLAHRLSERLRPDQTRDEATNDFAELKRAKLARIEPLLKPRTAYQRTPLAFDFLSEQLRREFHITDTDNVSTNEYDGYAKEVIERNRGGIVLDCGAGLRQEYLPDVVNFDVCSYPTTDVLGVGERLPFRSNSFDAVLSLSVLEHVRDPFACAAEIVRVLKPGGTLYCNVPFLQPLHGYPNHYFNMTHQGLRRLFEDTMVIDRQHVGVAGLPIFSLTWYLRNWLAALPPEAAATFASTTVGELVGSPVHYLDRSYVSALDDETNFELASSTALFAQKPVPPARVGASARIDWLRRRLSR